MEIIMHRANEVQQWVLAKENGWGIEVDLRSHLGAIYLSHDPIEDSAWLEYMPSFSSLIGMTKNWQNTVVLDCKETGLLKYMRGLDVTSRQYVLTDLIVPDQLLVRTKGGRTLTRRSKFENISITADVTSPFYFTETSEEFWIDYVFSPKCLEPYADIAKNSYIVSPELHKYQGHTPSTLYELSEKLIKCELSDEFIKTVYDMGFKGVCTHAPEKYAEHTGNK